LAALEISQNGPAIRAFRRLCRRGGGDASVLSDGDRHASRQGAFTPRGAGRALTRCGEAIMDEELEHLRRENAYLKQRCAQLQGDVVDLGSQVNRLAEQLDQHLARRNAPNPLSGGQDN
jgi:hypothetical protein